MISAILGLLGSPILGGIIGTVGAFFNKREDRKTLQLNLEHERDMVELTHRNRISELKVEGQIAETVVAGKAFESSQKYGNANSGVKWVDGLRSLIRPLITTYLLVVTSYLGYSLSMMVGGLDVLSPNELLNLYRDIVLSLLALTSMSVSWWFGSRSSSTKSIKYNDK